MILLDTNVLSALMRREPEPRIVDWLDHQPIQSVWTTSVTVLEIVMGIETLQPGPRRSQLQQAFESLIEEDLDGRVQPLDHAAAADAGRIAAERQRIGRTVDFRDVQIAGIARSRNATLATRNTRHFTDLDIALIDPGKRD